MADRLDETGEIHIAATTTPAALDPAAASIPVLPALGAAEPSGGTPHAPLVRRPAPPSLDVDALVGDASPAADSASPAAPVEPPGEPDRETEPDVPLLVLSDEEPPAVPSSVIDGLRRDAATLRTLRKLAGGQPDRPKARAALLAAVAGRDYDRADMPDGRTIALGILRHLVASGVSENALVDAIIAVLDDGA